MTGAWLAPLLSAVSPAGSTLTDHDKWHPRGTASIIRRRPGSFQKTRPTALPAVQALARHGPRSPLGELRRVGCLHPEVLGRASLRCDVSELPFLLHGGGFRKVQCRILSRLASRHCPRHGEDHAPRQRGPYSHPCSFCSLSTHRIFSCRGFAYSECIVELGG